MSQYPWITTTNNSAHPNWGLGVSNASSRTSEDTSYFDAKFYADLAQNVELEKGIYVQCIDITVYNNTRLKITLMKTAFTSQLIKLADKEPFLAFQANSFHAEGLVLLQEKTLKYNGRRYELGLNFTFTKIDFPDKSLLFPETDQT